MPELDDDLSASTARFQAFAEDTNEEPAPWQMRVGKSKFGLLAAIVVVVAVIAALVAALLAS